MLPVRFTPPRPTTVLLCVAMLACCVVAHWVGYARGRQYGNVQAYYIGFEHGQADGIATAHAAYMSGGIDAVKVIDK